MTNEGQKRDKSATTTQTQDKAKVTTGQKTRRKRTKKRSKLDKIIKQVPSPISGVPPPLEYRWKKGQSGNPKGRPKNAGATVREWYNLLTDKTMAQLKAITKDEKAPAAKVVAAKDWLAAMRSRPDKQIGPSTKRIIEHTDGSAVKTIKHEGQLGGLGVVIRIEDGQTPTLPPPPIREIESTSPNALPGPPDGPTPDKPASQPDTE